MYEREIKKIIEASENNALTIFVGAGVSALSHAPTWKELINCFCDEIGKNRKGEKEDFSSDEYLRIPQMYFYSINKNDKKYMEFIRDKLNMDGIKTNEIHQKILQLNPKSIITTNYDDLLERAAKEYGKTYKVVSRDDEVPTIFGDNFILKMHGDFKSNRIVLKEEDYLEYSEHYKLIETLVKSVFATNTVVFIGYGLGDYNVKMILNWTKLLLNEKNKKQSEKKQNLWEPIFIYTSDDRLSNADLKYYESEGLSVVDWHNLIHYPTAEPFGELNQVGLLCFLDRLEKIRFKEFLGISDLFDFYTLMDQFDFDRFNVSWLLNMNKPMLKRIAENEKAKGEIRRKIAENLKPNQIKKIDSVRLQEILIEYFC